MKKQIIFILIAGFVILMIALNVFIMSQMKEKKEPPRPVSVEPTPQIQSAAKPKATGALSQKEWLDINREYRECTIFSGDTEIARFKVNVHDQKLFDLIGSLPDATIPFEDTITRTKGTISYRNQKRHGPYIEYYENGKVAKEINYYNDQARSLKEYFYDGSLRMEIDYTDAIFAVNDPEVGIGKVYSRDGVLKYEWNLTNAGPDRYKKSYNVDGSLTQIETFDSNGNLVERKRF